MNLHLNEDQIMLQDTAAKLFKTEVTPESLRASEQTNGFDANLWSQVVELGFHAMRVTEGCDGLEMPLFDTALVAEEYGRYIAPIPFCEALAANRLLSLLGTEAANTLCAQAVSGEKLISFVPSNIQGSAATVPWSAIADGVLALDGDEVVLIEELKGLETANLGSAGHSLCELTGEQAAGKRTVIAQGENAKTAFLTTVEEWKLLTAAAMAGLSRQSLAMAADYANERVQFDRLIGSYQGIAHPLAEGLANTEGTQLIVWRTIWAIANQAPGEQSSPSSAFWWATEVVPRTVATCLRTFGGYGVSLEYDIQLYYRRSKAWSLLAGDPQHNLVQAGNQIWADASTYYPDTGPVNIDFSLGETAAAMADEIREFMEANLTDELREKSHHSVAGYDEAFSKKLCEAGLRYPHWPKEYGGREATPFEMAALNAVLEDYGWERITGPVTNQIAMGVMEFATQEVKDEVIGQFGRGDALACLGFSEPSSGSDIYGAKTSAVRDGDDWIINGQKIFTTSGNLAKYIFLLTKTDPDVPKHKGITIFIVPMDIPGIEIHPVHTLQDERTNITYLENVRVPDKYRLGEVNGGIKVMLHAMSMEHGGGDSYRLNYEAMLKNAVQWAQTTQRNGQAIINEQETRTQLARVNARQEVARALCFRAMWANYYKQPGGSYMGPVSKLFSTESYLTDSLTLTNVAAPWSLFEDKHGSGHIELGYRQSIGTTIYGGTSEIMRSLIAEHGLGLPKSR